MIAKIRYTLITLLITLIALPVIYIGLMLTNFTVVSNHSNNEVTVYVKNENENTQSNLLSIFNFVFVGFPRIEGGYRIDCRDSDKFTDKGYNPGFAINWEELENTDLSC